MRERNESSEMMEGFWNGLVFRALFTLMLFLRSLMPSILSLVTRPSFVERKSLFKNSYWLLILIVPRLFKENLLMQGELC